MSHYCDTPACPRIAIVFSAGRHWCLEHWATRQPAPAPHPDPLPANRWASATDVAAILERLERLERTIADRTADS